MIIFKIPNTIWHKTRILNIKLQNILKYYKAKIVIPEFSKKFYSIDIDNPYVQPLIFITISTWFSVEANYHILQIKSLQLFCELKFKC